MKEYKRIIRTMIVDDEPHAREELEYLLLQHSDVQVVYRTGNSREILQAVEQHQPHIVFLDVRMPGVDGLQAAEKILESQYSPLIVFATAHEEFAVRAFEINAVDYLLKPFSGKRVDRCIERIRALLSSVVAVDQRKLDAMINFISSVNPRKRLAIELNGKAVIIDEKDVVLAYCSDGQLVIHTREKRFVSNMTLQELQLKLDDTMFFRSHRAYLVNVERIREVIPWFNGTYNLILEEIPNMEIPVSRQHAPKLKKLFEL